MDLLNSFLNFVVPPASLVMLAFSWPALCFISGCEWLYNVFNGEIMEDKVVIITGASSGIGEVTILFSSCIILTLSKAIPAIKIDKQEESIGSLYLGAYELKSK